MSDSISCNRSWRGDLLREFPLLCLVVEVVNQRRARINSSCAKSKNDEHRAIEYTEKCETGHLLPDDLALGLPATTVLLNTDTEYPN